MKPTSKVINGDALEVLKTLDAESVQCVVTSPPYFGLRDYQIDGQIGLEKTPSEYIAKLVEIFREVRRVLKDDGTVWLNLGDSYVGASSNHKNAGSFGENSCISKKTQSGVPNDGRSERNKLMSDSGLKMKQLLMMPHRVAIALQEDGWYVRQDIVWAKPNPMPESVTDRCTKAHEYIFLLSKSQNYYFDNEAIQEKGNKPAGSNGTFGNKNSSARLVENLTGNMANGVDYFINGRRNKRSVWTVNLQPFPEAHFATFPPEIPTTCIKAGTRKGGTVLDIFSGAGTTGFVAVQLERNYIGIELNPEYVEMSERRISRAMGIPMDIPRREVETSLPLFESQEF